jgi:hypothetical protein
MKKLHHTFFIAVYFLFQLSAQVPIFSWVNTIVSNSEVRSNQIVVDSMGNTYSAGYCFSSNNGFINVFNDLGMKTIYSKGVSSIFIQKINSKGRLVWIKTIGGFYNDYCYSLALDKADNIYVCGEFQVIMDVDPGPGVFSLSAKSTADGFVLKLDNAGNFIWSQNFSYIMPLEIKAEDSGAMIMEGLLS